MVDELTVRSLMRMQRQKRGMSARSLSVASGLSESVAGKIEAGTMLPSLRVFARLAVTLQLTPLETALLVHLAAQEDEERLARRM